MGKGILYCPGTPYLPLTDAQRCAVLYQYCTIGSDHFYRFKAKKQIPHFLFCRLSRTDHFHFFRKIRIVIVLYQNASQHFFHRLLRKGEGGQVRHRNHTQIFLLFQNGKGLFLILRCNHDFHKKGMQNLCDMLGYRSVQGKNPPEERSCITGIGLIESFINRIPDSDSGRIVMLGAHHCRLGKFLYKANRIVHVRIIIVGQLLSVELLPFCRIFLIYLLVKCGILMGILPIAKTCPEAIAHT